MHVRFSLFARWALAAVSLSTIPTPAVAQFGRRTLTPYESDVELSKYLTKLAERRATVSQCQGDVVSISTVSARGDAMKQPAVVYGTVTSTGGSPVEQSQVSIPSMAVGTSTDAQGAFRLVLPSEKLSKVQAITGRALRIGYRARAWSVTAGPGDSVRVDVKMCQETMQLNEAIVTAAGPSADAITNVQHCGIDEGDIVKLSGDYLVVLRRGRLFTVAMNDQRLQPIAMSDAFGPGIDPQHAWYDEMLLYRDKVVVVGYSYERGGTEIGVFRLDARGGLSHQGTYHLKSNDYYSARNYASRLIGSKLVFYAPLYMNLWAKDPFELLPAVRKWSGDSSKRDFRRIASPSHIYRAGTDINPGDVALHTVTSCDLAADDLKCEATAVIGPGSRVFYVSPKAVYVWTSRWRPQGALSGSPSMLYRLPLDGSRPSVIGVSGSPVDQFSFFESDDGFINIFVLSDGRGDAMWRSERSGGSAAFLRIAISDFDDGSTSAPASAYRELPTPTGGDFQNRFVGDLLLYGVGNGWGRPSAARSTLFGVRWKTGAINQVALSHPIDRIEVMGRHAIVVGADSTNLQFTGVSLERGLEVKQRYTLRDAAQGELRSHGFFYRADDRDAGIVGLPVRAGGDPGYSHLIKESASVVFIRNADDQFKPLGQLASLGGNTHDGCRASCVDWYGNARPIFARGRVFALLGYELVEGKLNEGRIDETRRVNFGPR